MLVLLLSPTMQQKRSTFGSLIDLIVRIAQTSADKKVTEFVEQLADGSRLSARQVNRMRDYRGFPEDKSIEKLIEVLPDIDLLDPETIPSRLLLPWSVVERDQDKLPENTSITIVSGWQPPKATYQQNIAKSIAVNIAKGFSYTFVYPHISTYKGGEEAATKLIDEWMNDVRKKVSLEWERYITWELDKENKNTETKMSIVDDVDQHIGATNTNQKSEFWFSLPAPYCVFYNLGLKDRDPSSRHGIFNAKGLLMADVVKRSADRNDAFSEGWLLTTEEQFKEIEASFIADTPEWSKYIRKTS
jgi:hypothetical protein